MLKKIRDPWMDRHALDQFNEWVPIINDLLARVAVLEGRGNAPTLGGAAGESRESGGTTDA